MPLHSWAAAGPRAVSGVPAGQCPSGEKTRRSSKAEKVLAGGAKSPLEPVDTFPVLPWRWQSPNWAQKASRTLDTGPQSELVVN